MQDNELYVTSNEWVIWKNWLENMYKGAVEFEVEMQSRHFAGVTEKYHKQF